MVDSGTYGVVRVNRPGMPPSVVSRYRSVVLLLMHES
jgi:hypothetical protein